MIYFLSLIGNKTNFLWNKIYFFGIFILSLYFDNFFRLWNPNAFVLKTKRYLGHKGIVIKFCGSKHNNNLITCSTDNFIKIWDYFSCRPLRSILIKFDIIQSIALNLRNQVLVCLGKETVTLWDTYNGSCFNSFSFFPNFRPSVTFLENSDIFCIAQNNNSVAFFDLKNGSILKKLFYNKKNIFVEWISESNLFIFFKKIIIFINLKKFPCFRNFYIFPWIFEKNKIFQLSYLENYFLKIFKTKKILKFSRKENFIKIADIETGIFLINS